MSGTHFPSNSRASSRSSLSLSSILVLRELLFERLGLLNTESLALGLSWPSLLESVGVLVFAPILEVILEALMSVRCVLKYTCSGDARMFSLMAFENLGTP
jgi:hypothetical protein